MKREVAIALLFLFTLMGCTKSVDLPVEDGAQPTNNISLNVGGVTRGTEVDSEAGMGSVGMFCAHTVADNWNRSLTDFNKMNNGKFTYKSNAWVWKPAENGGNAQPTWGHSSLTEKYTFFAYSPHQATGVSIVNGQPQITYTVPETVADQTDLMVAKPRKNIHPQSGGKVHMEFEHALSKVEFSVKGDGTRKIKSITLKGLKNKGTLKYKDASPYFEWTNTTSIDNFTVEATTDIKDVIPDDDGTTETPLTTTNGYLFMLPQDASGKTVTVVTTDASEVIEESADITFPANTIWTAGGSYNYIINAEESIPPYFHEVYPDVANCYMVTKSASEVTIPISEYISYFWANYGADDTEKGWANLTADDLEAEVIWSENGTGATDISIIDVDAGSGSLTKDNVNKETTNFTASTSTMVMKFTVNGSDGNGNNNFTIGVKKIGSTEYLWSWHIWVTDYNPYGNGIEAGSNTWMDRNLGAYVNTYAGSDDKGTLYYQWGRKDPLPFNQTSGANTLSTATNIAAAVKAPGKFYTGNLSSNYDFCGTNTDWDQDRAHHWRDKMLANTNTSPKYDSRKSIFDPSPLGWMVPGSTSLDSYASPFQFMSSSTSGNSGRTGSGVYFPASGYRDNGDGSLLSVRSNGYSWSASPYSSYSGYYLYFHSGSVDPSNYFTRSGGFAVRPVQE